MINKEYFYELNNSKKIVKLFELFSMLIKIFFYEFILKISLNFIFKRVEFSVFKNFRSFSFNVL